MTGFGNQVLFFFSSLGAFNGLILGIYFIFFTAKKNLSNYFLGALLLALSIRIGKSVAFFFDYNVPKTILQIGLTACAFIGPFLYFFIKSELDQTRKLPGSWTIQLAVWATLILTVGAVIPYEGYPFYWTDRIIPLIYLQWGCYVAFSVSLLIPLFKKMVRKENMKTFEKWILTICGAVFLIYMAYVWAFLNITKGSYITGPLNFSLILYLMIFILLYRKKTSDLSSFSGQKNGDKKLSGEDAQFILDKLKKAMTEKELFKNPNLKINDVAREINVSGHQLSQLLNNSLSKNFTLFVNEYRINEACKLIITNHRLTFEAIGYEVGYNSKSTFYTAFKKVKDTTPALFKESIEKIAAQ